MPDSRDFISADDFEIISDNNKSSHIKKLGGENVIEMKDEWTSTTNTLSGDSSLIDSTNLADIWDFPVDNIYLDDNGALFFQDDTISETDSSGCQLDDGIISLQSLSGDLDLLKEFDRINNFGKVFDVQFRDITHGQYRYANTRVCNIVANALGFLSLDKLINDERARQKRVNELNSEFEGTDREADFPPYDGFLVSEEYVNEGWINFDQVIHDRLNDKYGYDEDVSIALRTKRFKEAKRVLVQMALTYSSNIPVLGSNNKITDFGVRVVDRTTGQRLDLSNYKNDNHTDYGNSGLATYTGKLEYVTETDIESDVTCNPCGKYKIVKCEGTIYREQSCENQDQADLGVSHEIAPQFRINPLIETREKKPDILNTIDPIHWTGGTQDLSEDQWKGITQLREEFGEDNLHAGRLAESRAFHYADGNFEKGFTVGGFAYDLNDDNDLALYGSRKTTERWDGKDWNLIPFTLPVSRSAGLAGSDNGNFNVIAFGTRGVHDIDGEGGDVLASFATPVPSSFETNYQTSKTEYMDYELGLDWTETYCAAHTNVPRHSVAGKIIATKQFTTSDGKKIEPNTVDNCAGTEFKLSDLIGEDLDEDTDISLSVPNDVFSSLNAFVRDNTRRAAGKGVATSLKLIGPNYDVDEALLESKSVPYIQDDTEKIPSPCFSQNTKGAMDFVIKKNDGTSDNYGSGSEVEVTQGPPIGIAPDTFCEAVSAGQEEELLNIANNVESWEHPVQREDGSIIFVDKSNQVDPQLLKDTQRADHGDWYEIYNARGIAFNGSTGGLITNGITDDELSDVFEYFHYIKFVQHTTRRKTSTSYEPVTFVFEDGAYCIDQNRKYPIKTVGTKYVGGERKGLATGGKTSNRIFGCDDNSASLNIKYGYFSDDRYDEFNNSIVNVAYELDGDSWIRRDNLPENVAWHTGVGDEKHAIFWGGLHASLEMPDVSVAFPGCDDWKQAIATFGGTFNIRGNTGLDGEARYTFFSTRFDDDFVNTYYKANDKNDSNELGVDYSTEWLNEYDPQVTQQWSEQIERSFSHVYWTAYETEDANSGDSFFRVNYYVNGSSWISDISLSAVVSGGADASGESADEVGGWLKDFMDNNEYNKYLSSYRPDTDDNTLNGGNTNVDATGIFPTRFNYFLNDFEGRTPVWKYSGHPVEGSMWIWSRPNPGEELFDPRSIHAEPKDGEWQSSSIWNKHSFQNHIGYESFFAKWEENYDDLEDNNTFASEVIKDNSKFIYWVIDNYDATGQNTFSTLYEYDAEKIEQFYQDFADYTDSCVAWQHYLARKAGRARVRSEDIKYRIEYLTNRDFLTSTAPLSITKNGTIDTTYGSGVRRIDFIQRLPEFLNEAFCYDVDIQINNSGISNVVVKDVDPTGFTVEIIDTVDTYDSLHEDFIFTDSMSQQYTGTGFIGTDSEATIESISEGTSASGTITWSIDIDIRLDFLEMFLHGINKNLNQNHGTPLEVIALELRAYNEDQTGIQVDMFSIDHMQYLLNYHYELGNIDKDKLSPPFIAHVPEEGLSTPSSGYQYSVSPYEVQKYQDLFTNPDSIPPYGQLVLNDHYPSSPITNQNWFLSRYALNNFWNATGTEQIQRKILSYTKTDTENPLMYRYKDIVATGMDPVTRRQILAPESYNRFVTDFNVDLDHYSLQQYKHNRYEKVFYPDSILSTSPGGIFQPITSESDTDRWGLTSNTSIKIYDSNNVSSGKLLENTIAAKEGNLDCVLDNATLTTLTGLTTGNNTFFKLDELSSVTEDDNFFIVSGSKIILYGRNIEDSLDPKYDGFRYSTINEVISSPGNYATAQASYPCLTFPIGYDLDPEFRVYHSMFATSEGGYFGAFIPSVATITNAGPLEYPDWMLSGGLIWTGQGNPENVSNPQNSFLYAVDTTRKIVVGDSSLLGNLRLPRIDGIGSEIITVSNIYRDSRNIIVPDYARSSYTCENSPYTNLERSRLQLYRTNHGLIDRLREGNTLDIFGGSFDVFWFNNITTVDPADTNYINPEPRLRGYSTNAYDANTAFEESWNYGWNTNYSYVRFTETINVSGDNSYTGDFDDVQSNYTQDKIINVTIDPLVKAFLDANASSFRINVNYEGGGTAVVSNESTSGFDLTINDWYPLVKETFTESPSGSGIVTKSLVEVGRDLEYEILYTMDSGPINPIYDPFNQGSNVLYSEEDVNNEKYRFQYDDNHWPNGVGTNNFNVLSNEVIYDKCIDDISFAYHYGYERAFVDYAYDYYRYRFLDVQDDLDNWLYAPYTSQVENNVLKLNNFATDVDTPEYMTYTFYMDRSCEGLDQFFYGQDNNQFVERWKFPHSTEVLNNLRVTALVDGIDTLVTRSGDDYVDIQQYRPLQKGSLSVGEFTYPAITGTQIRNGVENPLKDIILGISQTTCDGITASNFDELNTWLDSNNISGGPVNCYYPLSYDPYAGNSALLPNMPYFKENDTNFRFDPTKTSSTIRDRAACWPWCDLLDGDSTKAATQGDYTWHFTKDGKFWLAEVTYVGSKKADPLNRTITNNIFDGSEKEEVYRIRCYDAKGNLEFDYQITYQDHAGPQFIIEKNIASDFNVFGTDLKSKTISLDKFNSRPINGTDMVDSLNNSESVWQAVDWNHFSVDVDKFDYRYRHKELCDVIRDGYNKTIIPQNGKLCKVKDVSKIWIYSIPFSDDNIEGTIKDQALWIEENPLAISEFTSGSAIGYYDTNNDLIENITPTPVVSVSGIGSQILYKRTYDREDGNTGLRYTRALISGPSSRGTGMFNWGKSQGYNGQLIHQGNREYIRYSLNDSTSVIPDEETLYDAWPWNVIGNGGELGARSYTDTIDTNGNYWFAFGDRDNLEDIEAQTSNDVNFKQAYIIGMVSADNIENFKVALGNTNYIKTKDTLELLEQAEENPDYVEFSLIEAQVESARLREGIIEAVNSQDGDKFFELFVYLIDENVTNVDEEGYEEQKAIADADASPDPSSLPALPLPPLDLTEDKPSVVQDLVLVSETDPDCLICNVCDLTNTNYSELENPTPWVQHNHDDWVAPFLESPFSGPFNSDSFNIWLTAGETNPWGTQVWSRIENGKVWASYRRHRIHIDRMRDKLILMSVTGTIAVEDFAAIAEQNLNVPVYCTYDEFLFELEDYKNLNVVELLGTDDLAIKLYHYGIDCNDDFAVYNPLLVNTEPVSSCSIDPSGCITEGISGNIICPDLTPNEVYVEWATGFVQEYKERQQKSGGDQMSKYYFKYNVANTYDSNTFLDSDSITDKEIVEYDWRRYQNGVGCGGAVPLINILESDDLRCINLNECYIGQASFGNPDKAVVFGGFAVPADGQSGENIWWSRFSAKSTFKWNTTVISPEDDLNANYRHRTTSPFFTNGEQTMSKMTLGMIMFDLGKEVIVERQGIAKFNQQNEYQVTFVDEIPDFFANNDKYSIVMQPDQNVKAWWVDKTPTGFTIKVEFDSWTGSIDWQVILIDTVPSEDVDGIGDAETFDKWDNL